MVDKTNVRDYNINKSNRYSKRRKSMNKVISKTQKVNRNEIKCCQKQMLALGLPMIIFSIFICSTSVTAKAWGNVESEKRYKYYTTVYVERNMTLWDIADEYMTEEYKDKRDYIDEVLEINQLASDNLVYGSTICVPYYSSEYK